MRPGDGDPAHSITSDNICHIKSLGVASDWPRACQHSSTWLYFVLSIFLAFATSSSEPSKFTPDGRSSESVSNVIFRRLAKPAAASLFRMLSFIASAAFLRKSPSLKSILNVIMMSPIIWRARARRQPRSLAASRTDHGQQARSRRNAAAVAETKTPARRSEEKSYGTETKVFGEPMLSDGTLARLGRNEGVRRMQTAERAAVVGSPDLESLTTSHIERAFLTVRQELKRFQRKGLGYSKSVGNAQARGRNSFRRLQFCAQTSHAWNHASRGRWP